MIVRESRWFSFNLIRASFLFGVGLDPMGLEFFFGPLALTIRSGLARRCYVTNKKLATEGK